MAKKESMRARGNGFGLSSKQFIGIDFFLFRFSHN